MFLGHLNSRKTFWDRRIECYLFRLHLIGLAQPQKKPTGQRAFNPAHRRLIRRGWNLQHVNCLCHGCYQLWARGLCPVCSAALCLQGLMGWGGGVIVQAITCGNQKENTCHACITHTHTCIRASFFSVVVLQTAFFKRLYSSLVISCN